MLEKWDSTVHYEKCVHACVCGGACGSNLRVAHNGLYFHTLLASHSISYIWKNSCKFMIKLPPAI